MRMSGWIAWRQMPPELVMGSSLLIGHHQSLSRMQALVPHRQGTSLAAKMVCGRPSYSQARGRAIGKARANRLNLPI
jgi:hypothetical protein